MTRVVDQANAGAASEELIEALQEDLRKAFGAALHHLHRRLVDQAPQKTGAFRSSIIPFAGEPPAAVPHAYQEGGGAPAGRQDVEAVMASWRPGMHLGVASDAPYSRKILFHGLSKRIPQGWLAVVTAEANRVLEEGRGR